VQLGDSIASGEGINYNWVYNPTFGTWTDLNPNPTWNGPYQGCHQSSLAYGNLVAQSLDNANFTTFACTGATYEEGIEGSETANGEVIPPQFGPWPNGPSDQINEAYDAAEPDVVLVSVGADDIQFGAVIASCIQNALAYAASQTNTLLCTRNDPGPTVEADYFANIGGVEDHIEQLAKDITNRGKDSDTGIIPKIVFNDYFTPFPTAGTTCPDTGQMYPAQLSYLNSLDEQLDRTVKSGVTRAEFSLPNVGYAELLNAFAGHQWCSDDPYAYGLSIEVTDQINHPGQINPSPFHPTPDGQQAIATIVTAQVESLLDKTTTSTARTDRP
jgi:hypothetical protein